MHSAEYRSNAAACLLAAENAKVPDAKARWLAMAQAWSRLAEDADRHETHNVLISRYRPSEAA